MFTSSQRLLVLVHIHVLVLVDHMHVDCSLLPQGVLHLVLHMLGDRRLVDCVVGVDGSGEDTLAVTVSNRGMIFIIVPLHVRQLATHCMKDGLWCTSVPLFATW